MRTLIILTVLAFANSIESKSYAELNQVFDGLGRAATFSFDDTSKWKDTYPNCGLQHQTPIDLVVKESLRICPRNKLSITNFHVRPKSLKISNTGVYVGWTHTYETGQEPTICGGPLSGTYKLYGMHFHWGENDTVGSEHAINGCLFAGELHIAFYNTKYPDVDAAKVEQDGIAVFGIVVRVVPSDISNCLFNEMIIKKLTNPSDSYMYQPNEIFSLQEILPKKVFMWPRDPPCSLDNYFHYRGSFAAPPCDETITWIMSTRKIRVKRGSFAPFRELIDAHNKKMIRNYRDLQPLNNRKVDIIGDC